MARIDLALTVMPLRKDDGGKDFGGSCSDSESLEEAPVVKRKKPHLEMPMVVKISFLAPVQRDISNGDSAQYVSVPDLNLLHPDN